MPAGSSTGVSVTGISRYRAGRFGERGGYLSVLGGYLFPVAAFFG